MDWPQPGAFREVVPPRRPGSGFQAALLFQVSNPLDPWGVQALEINLDFILVFEGFGLFTFGEHGLILFFFPLKRKTLPQADEKAFLHISSFKTTL